MKLLIAVLAFVAVSAVPAQAAIIHGGGNPADAADSLCGSQMAPTSYTHIILNAPAYPY